MQNRCLSCEGTDFSELFHIRKFPIFFGAVPKDKRKRVESFPLTIAICESCSLIQQVNLLDEKILCKLYTADYYNCPSPLATGMGTEEIDKFYSFFRKCRVEKGTLLEIACFDGYLLLKLLNDGWDVYGCDPSPMAKLAMENLGKKKIINDFFTKDTFPTKKFDVIILRNLMEHLYDIQGFLQSVSKCLRPGGRIFIDVPNVTEVLKIGGFGTFFHQHISYFSLQTLEKLLSQYGFIIENSYEGSPNLFIDAVKGDVKETSNLRVPILLKSHLSLKREKKVSCKIHKKQKTGLKTFLITQFFNKLRYLVQAPYQLQLLISWKTI